MALFRSHRVRPTDATPLRRVLRCDLRKPLFRSHRVRPTDATPLRRVDGRHYGQSSIVDETPDGSESRPYRSPFAMPRHRSSIVQSSIVIRPSSHRPIVKVGVITPPLDPLPVQRGDGCWALSPAPFPGTHRQSSIVQDPTTTNQQPTFPDVGTAFRPVRPARNTRRRHSPAPIVDRQSAVVLRSDSINPNPLNPPRA